MIYLQIENQLFFGETFKILVCKMWETSFDEAINKQDFMFNVQDRIKELYNKAVETNNYQQFIEDLDHLSLVKLFRCKDCDYHIESSKRCLRGVDIFQPEMFECKYMENKEILRMKGIK